MKGQGRSVAGASSRGTLGALVVAEVALAVLLLFAAGVMVDSFRRLQTRDLGLDPVGVLTLQADMTANRYASAEARGLFVGQTLDRLSRIPGVESAAITTINPLCCGAWVSTLLATAGLLLAALGLYGVLSFVVAGIDAIRT